MIFSFDKILLYEKKESFNTLFGMIYSTMIEPKNKIVY